MVPLSCSLQCSRITLLVLTILFLLFGFAILGFGIYLLASQKFDVAFFEDINAGIIGGKAIETVGIILTIVGIFTVLVSGLGCLGTLIKHRVLLYVYSIVLVALIFLELAAFITALSLRVRVRNSYDNSLWNVFDDAYKFNRTDSRKAVEKLEEEFKCCGVDGSEDYININYTIPASCYENRDMSGNPFSEGCSDAIINWIWDEMPIIGGIVGTVLILEIFGVISSYSLAVVISHSSYGELRSWR